MSVAKSYANALFQAVHEVKELAHDLGQVEDQLDTFLALLDSSAELKVALLSPVTHTQEKVQLVDTFAKRLEFSPLVHQFISLLAKKGRLTLLKKIRDVFDEVRIQEEGGVLGRLVAAEPMEEKDIGILAKAFSQKFGKKVAFRVSTDPSLLAGMRVTVNGVTYDGTLRSQLQKLRDRFVAEFSGNHA